VHEYLGTNLNGVGMYTLLVSMHVLLMSACSSVMLATKCLVQVKHDVSTSNKLLVLCYLIMMNMCCKYEKRDTQLLSQIGLICLSPECGYVCMYARIHVIMSYARPFKYTPYHHVRLSHFHAFIRRHYRISFRYARCMRSTWCGTEPKDGVGVPS
jgi:hypothetical protein